MKIFIDPEGHGNTSVPNIGLAYISAQLNLKREEHKIIDQLILPKPKNRFLKYKTDWYGISVKMNTYKESRRISHLIWQKSHNAKIVFGGPHITCAFERVKRENPGVELFMGEMDYTTNLDTLPFPCYSNFDSYGFLYRMWSSGKRSYPIITSRGCPYSCTYCASPLVSGKKWRARSAENCYEELYFAKKTYQIKSFDILDDCFNLDKQRVMKFCELVRKLNLRWACGNGLRANIFDEEIAKAMAEAGCISISFGVESISPEVLKNIKKGEDFETIEKAIDIAKKYMRVNVFFIIGLPGASYETDMAGLEWALRKKIGFHFSYLVPFEGTELYKLPVYYGKNFDDALFFGKGAHPVSEEYPHHLQEKIYKMTAYMRPDYKPPIIVKILRKIKNLFFKKL